MFSKILVPLDGTSEAGVAVAPARTLAKATGAGLMLLEVIHSDASAHEETSATARLDAAKTDLTAEGLVVLTSVRRGEPAAEIIAATAAAEADLVIMATHGRSGLARAFLGSVAQRVLAASPVPVVLLRPGGPEMTKLESLLVAVDGSPGGALALASAVPLARAVDARVILLDVAVPFLAYMTMAGAVSNGGMFYFDPTWDDEATETAKGYVNGMADRLRQIGVRAEGMITTGSVLTPSTSVAEAITQAAEEIGADLIVMSTHALTGPARTLLGSVADAVVRHSHRPVLLPRRMPSEDEPHSVADDAAPTLVESPAQP